MENENAAGVTGTPVNQQSTGVAPPISTGGMVSVPSNLSPPVARKAPLTMRPRRRWQWIALSIGVLLLIGGGVAVVLSSRSSKQPVETGEFNNVQIPLETLDLTDDIASGAQRLKVNGLLQLSGSVVVNPGVQPQNPILGQMYMDQTTGILRYYNGQSFVNVGGGSVTNNTTNLSTTNVTNLTTTNVTNVFNTINGNADSVALQATAPGLQQTGNFNISGTGQMGTLVANSFNVSGTGQANVLQSASLAVSGTGQIGVVRTGNISNATSVTLATDNAAGAIGDIAIKTGDSSTTSAGDISIDTGTGIIDGEVINTKTFETSTEHMAVWTGAQTTVAQTTAQARTGTHSLAFSGTTFSGILEDNNFPVTPVVPGHNYFFSAWVRAATVGAPISGNVHVGSTTIPLTTVTDNTTGWTQMTGQGIAPAGAAAAFFSFGFNQGVLQTHYFDDIVTIDLSSATATSIINIGTTNAQFVNLGNINQLGATKIFGSGLTLNGGVGNLDITGGAMNITGSASSVLKTTSGRLDITSAGAATWKVGQAATGNGDDLNIKAGNAAGGVNDNGGNLILQGGGSGVNGIAGSVVAKGASPQSPSTFAVQTFAGDTALNVATSTPNVVTNRSFELGVTGWFGASGATISQETTTAANIAYNKASLKVTTAAAVGSSTDTNTFTSSPNFATSATWTLSFDAKLASGSFTTLEAGYAVSGGGGAIPCTLNTNTMSTSGFTRYKCTITLTSGQTISDIFFRQTDATARIFYIDGVQLVPGNASIYQEGTVQLVGPVTSTLAVQATNDSSAAFQVQNAAGNGLLTVDSINGFVGIGQIAPTSALTVTGAISVAGTDAAINLYNQGNTTASGNGFALQTINNSLNIFNLTDGHTAMKFNRPNSGPSDVQILNNWGLTVKGDNANAISLQDGLGSVLFKGDTTTMRVTIGGTTSTFANLVLDNSHFKSTQTNPPTIGTPTDCGTGPAAAVNAGSTDTAGSFTITTGLGGTSAACDTVFTFNKSYGAAPKSIIVVGNSDANSVLRQAYVSSSNATTFTVRFATSAGGANNTMYSFNYWVVE